MTLKRSGKMRFMDNDAVAAIDSLFLAALPEDVFCDDRGDFAPRALLPRE